MAFNFVVWFFLLRTVYFYKDVSSSAIVAWIKNKTQTAVILSTLWTFAFFNKFDVYFQKCTTKGFFFILLTSILSRWLQTDYSRTGWLHSCRYFSNRSFICRFVLYIYISVWFCQRCSLGFRVLLDVSREPRPEPIRGWVASLFSVKNQGGREGRFCHFD